MDYQSELRIEKHPFVRLRLGKEKKGIGKESLDWMILWARGGAVFLKERAS